MAPHPPAVATFFAPKLADEATVLEFRGSEALCRPYQFDIHLRVTGMSSREMDEQAAVGSAATLKLRRGADGRDAPFVFQGILSKVAVLVETREWALYQVSLVPRLWQLGLTRHSRVFTKMTVPDILAEVLESADLSQGSDFELRLQGDYPQEELVTMYGESKLAFLHRWMEREGMVYFFEHDPDGEGAAGGDKLIIADHPAAHAALAEGVSVPYRPLADDDNAAGACFDTFAMLRGRVVGAVKLSDYDYARPALELSAAQAVSDGQGFGQMVQHLGRFFDPEQAKRYAQLRAEAIQAREVTYHLAGSAFHLSAGWLVDVAEHARDAHNGRYLVHEVQHMGNQLGDELPPALERLIQPLTDRVYRAEARTVHSDTPFRPQQTTNWPRVAGYENAIVDGPADSEYAQIDDQGRYLVQMHFDESELTDGKRSTYVRMMQPHGGQTEGFHFPLRKGTEVKLGFDEGDPDRPFIAGVVPNATTPSPVTKTNHTQNVIST
ncbi:MAG: type VI secretion system tip protein TssI/VgrG, partial [Myxococcota bacterium]